MSKSTTRSAKDVAEDNGIVNSSGIGWALFGPVFLAAVPLTSYITQPSSYIQNILTAMLDLIPGTNNRAIKPIPALSALYIFVTFAGMGAVSVAGQAMSRPEGLDNNSPRAHTNGLSGLALRMRSAHYNLMEMFPGFVLAAGLAQTLAPNDQQIINLLALHVFLKCFVYVPAYLADLAPPRSLSHVFATGSVINVCWRLALAA